MKGAPSGQEFYFCDGVVVNTVAKLTKHIKELSPEGYSYHVNQDKNDFYNWVYNCISKKNGELIKGNISQKDLLEKLKGKR